MQDSNGIHTRTEHPCLASYVLFQYHEQNNPFKETTALAGFLIV